MSLLDVLFGNNNKGSLTLNERDAFLAIVVSVALADGVIQQEESATIAVSLSHMKLFRWNNPDIEGMRKLINTHGLEATLNAAKQILPINLRETAFAVATDVAIADGNISQTEEDRLLAIYKALEVPRQTAEKIVEVMLIKHRA